MDCPSNSEEWRPIPGYEGIYEASNFGRVRTSFGKTTYNSRYAVRVWKQRVLKPKVQGRENGRKDQRVSLWKDGEETTQLVARLVAMTFLPTPFDKLTVNHINGNPMDNRVENLEWVTLSENIRHGFETGLYRAAQKPVVLTREDGYEIAFSSMAEASRYLGRNNGYVSAHISRCSPCYDSRNVKFLARLSEEGDSTS